MPKASKQPKTQADFRRLIAENNTAIVKIEDRELAIPDLRRRLALDAQTGDSEAREELAKVEAEALELAQQKHRLRAAIDGAERRIAQLDREAAEADLDRRHALIERLNREVSELAPRFDETITELNLIAARIDEIRAQQRGLTTVRTRIEPLSEDFCAIVLAITGGKGMLSRFVPRPMSVRNRTSSMRALAAVQSSLVEGACLKEREEFEAQAPVDHSAAVAA